MKKWMVIGLSSSTLLIWFAVIWIFIGQQNDHHTSYVEHHQQSQRIDLRKTIDFEDPILVHPIERRAENTNQETMEKRMEDTISIDTLLSELNIEY